jgi:hypothetical protein
MPAGLVGKLELVREMHGAGISLVSLGQSLQVTRIGARRVELSRGRLGRENFQNPATYG